MTTTAWTRVTRTRKCPICDHDSWCCIGERFICCMRSVSDKPCTNGGYLHALNGKPIDPIIIKRQPKKEVVIDFLKLIRDCQSETRPETIDHLASCLGVSSTSLNMLGCAWSFQHRAWAFPMHSADGSVIGIRLRTEQGQKFAVTGSHQGLFIPSTLPRKELMVLEGPTDTAAALTLDLFAIGKPSCLGCEQEIVKFISLHRIKRVVICADRDAPGQRGAEKLQSVITVPSVIYTPPAKDFRAAVAMGLTQDLLTATLKNIVWTKPVSKS